MAAQRGFLLTGDARFLGRYEKFAAEVQPRLERLQAAYQGSATDLADVRDLHVLIGKRLGDLSMLVTIQKTQGTAAAIALVKTRIGSDAGEAINDVLEQMRRRESLEHAAAQAYWSRSRVLSRWTTVTGTVFNMLLVGIAARLVYMDLRRRTLQTAELRDQKLKLEREAEDRNRELVELSTHLQSVSESEKAHLARELHDELGGLLASVRMDVSWAEERLSEGDSEVKQRLRRVHENLSAGLDLKRRITEELRPTLLDEVGLFAALRWQMQESCGRAGLKCMEAYPDEEPKFTSEAAITLFRVAQEAFTNILKHSSATSVDITVGRMADDIVMQISDDGKGIPAGRLSAVGSHGVVSMRHRIRALNGRLDIRSPGSGGTVLLVQVPVANALSPAVEAAPL